MTKFGFNKLVRDNIPEFFEQEGHIIEHHKLGEKALKLALLEKLHEEVKEAVNSNEIEELKAELADVIQVIRDICLINSIELEEVEQIREAKETKKGGFGKGAYIDSVEIEDSNNNWYQHLKSQPEKYPKID